MIITREKSVDNDKKLVYTNFELGKTNFIVLERRIRMMPLTLADPGQVNTIVRVGGKPEVRQHLETLGFVPGTDVSIVSKQGGNVIVNIKDSRIAIGQDLAQKIMV